MTSVLREILDVRQIRGEPKRRWFTSANMDLVVWNDENGSPVGFQLCYGKERVERAFTWRLETGFSHTAVDSGEDAGGLRYKATPILVAGGLVDTTRMISLLEKNSRGLPKQLIDFVIATIGKYRSETSLSSK